MRRECTGMRGLGGFVLLAGIGVGLFVYFPAPVDRDTSLEQAKQAVAERIAVRQTQAAAPIARKSAPTPTVSRLASFAPSAALTAPSRKSRVAAAPLAAATTVQPVPTWQTNVVPTPATAPIVGGPAGTLDPTDPEARYQLVVDIQQNLKRVGCYWGRANGAWNNNTRSAMQSFTSNTNAALPVDKPDYMLLSLLKSHNGRSCGAAETTTVAAPARGAKGEIVAAAQPEVLPWKAGSTAQTGTRLYTPLPNSVVASDPLPGRMAIGGPKDFPPAAQAPLIPGASPGPGAAPAQPGVATAALDPGVGAAPVAPAAAAKPPKQGSKKSSWRKPAQGTPRYNLMLSLGGVY